MISKYYYKLTPLVVKQGELIVDLGFDDNTCGGYPSLETFDEIDMAMMFGLRALKRFFDSVDIVDHADAIRLEIMDAKDNSEIRNVVIMRGAPVCSYCGSIGFFSHNKRLVCCACHRSGDVGDFCAGSPIHVRSYKRDA